MPTIVSFVAINRSLHWMWSLRIRGHGDSGVLSWAWVGISLILVLFAPSQLINGVPFWAAPLRAVGQALLVGTTFLTIVVVQRASAHRPTGVRLVNGLLICAGCFGIASWVVVRVRTDLAYSSGEFVLAAALSVLLATFPYFALPSYKKLATAALASGLGFVVFLGFQLRLTGTQQNIVSTSLKLISIKTYSGLTDPVINQGGAIEPYGKSFLVVTGHGTFYTLEWSSNGQSLISRRHSLTLPPDAVSSADVSQLTAAKMHVHRVVDLLIDEKSVPQKVYVSYQEWNAANKCFTLRVAVGPIESSESEDGSGSWKQIFETQPCLPMFPGMQYLETGGRMAWLGDRLLLTVGDLGMGGKTEPVVAPSARNDYGKVFLLDRTGRHELFTEGHRNPQGLLVDNEQRVWLTEHGPQGGDEVNLLRQGSNYGWPSATYGTEYGRYFWPLAPGGKNHGDFVEPVHAFVPSVGISNLIRVGSQTFAEWQGDLLVSSLIGRSLFRLRLRDERVIYVEPVMVGVRVRDLAEGADGRILLWADSGRVLVLAPGPSEPAGSVVFERCQSCHEARPGSDALGPSLRSVVGARVARESGFTYSPALQQLGGEWTEDRLDAFLSDPEAYAPGTTMSTGQVPDAKERRALIEFLKTYR